MEHCRALWRIFGFLLDIYYIILIEGSLEVKLPIYFDPSLRSIAITLKIEGLAWDNSGAPAQIIFHDLDDLGVA